MRDRIMLGRGVMAVVIVLGASGGAARAVTDKYNVIAAEHAACDSDAVTLCGDSAHDEDQLIVCMKRNSSQLSSACRSAFLAGLKRRHLRF